jgi:serine phosphatase RsbU (regulator of sigma subunit)
MWFTIAVTLIVVVYVLYGVNMVWWRSSPDFGWRTTYESGPNVVAQVLEAGQKAGLLVGDNILAINGQAYNTFDELYFKFRNNEPGSVNTYTVMRDGKTVEISITTGRIGLNAVLWRSGALFVIGLVYVLIGVLVFLMKPRAVESWLFLVMTSLIGILLSYTAPSDLMRPLWLFDVRLFVNVLFPAPIIHLALRFPRTRTFLHRIPWLWTVPYVLSLIHFVLYEMTIDYFWDPAPTLDLLGSFYIVLAVLIFLVSIVWNSLKDTSIIIRRQSQVILLGITLGFVIPTIDWLLRSYWDAYLFPNPTLGYVVFLIMFLLSIGYTIVKHDLFAIDVIVRRTYGYILSTAAIIGAYGLIVSVLNVTFQSSEISRSPLFSIIFALGVVFFFRPLHERFQGLVNQVFYRQRYDYRKTIKDISEAMISILDRDVIHKTLIGSVVKEMFLENGLLLLSDPAKHVYDVQVVEGDAARDLGSRQLPDDDKLSQVLQEKNDAVFRYDIDLNPAYEHDRKALQHTFDSFASELMLPLKYKDEMQGIISLGRKKSGKMFTPEDLDLLKTITNQSAVALENAKLFEENIEKSRMEEELKIAHDIQVSMLPEKAPTVEGFTIAARSIPAREVGGDFYDFIEIPGDGAGERLGIVVGDVSGKAVSGALVMAAARSIFRVLAESHASVEEVMSIGNARLNRDVKQGMFVALLYGVLDPRQKRLTLSNAGQTQPIVCPGDKSKPLYIDTQGDKFPLGILKDCDYRKTQVLLKQGDTVVFYTDGVVEAINDKGELYGFDRFMTSIAERRDLEAHGMLEKLIDDVLHYVGDVEQHDDLTVVVVKVE